MSLLKSNLDLVNDCDSFPYVEKNPEAHAELMSTLYTLTWDDGVNKLPIGFMTESVLNKLIKTPVSVKGELEIRRYQREVCVFQEETEEGRSKRVASTAAYWRENKVFKILDGWRDELYPVYGPNSELLYSVERTAAALLGVVMYGAHMTAYVRSPESSYGIKLWVPRRSSGKQTYSGMLDNTVAGGMATGEDPFECIIREAYEEASLPDALVRGNATAHGTVSYIYLRSKLASGEIGLVQPEVQYVFDLELPANITPKPNDTEVECFYLWTVEEVQDHMLRGEFKPNCALLMLDFFIRHGILTPDNEDDFAEIKSRLHRPLNLPGPHLVKS